MSSRDTVTAPHEPRASVPPLRAGDRLTRDEFERRYDATSGLKKAELIEGVVRMPPPAVLWEYHASPHARLIGCFFVYCAATPGVRVGDNASVRLNLDSEPQPDACLLIDPKVGGHARLSDDDYIEGAPDLVAEVSSSSVAFDQNVKRQLYLRNGVREYVHWRVTQGAIDWYSLHDAEYRLIDPDPEGILKSVAFPGLWLDQKAMADEALARVMEVLQAGIASREHSDFVRQLESRRPLS